jgi:transglutaminase-like putative cysteine protease
MKSGFWTKFFAFALIVVLFGGSTFAMQQWAPFWGADQPQAAAEIPEVAVLPSVTVPDDVLTANKVVLRQPEPQGEETKEASGEEANPNRSRDRRVSEKPAAPAPVTKPPVVSGEDKPAPPAGEPLPAPEPPAETPPPTPVPPPTVVDEAKPTPSSPYRTISSRNHRLLTKVVVTNNTEETSDNVRIEVPLISSGSVYQSRRSESFSPEPAEIKTVSGTRVAVFRLGALDPGGEAVVEIRTDIRFSLVEFLADYVPTDTKKSSSYLSAGSGIESDNSQIINLSGQITAGLSSDWEQARAITRWVASNIAYDATAANRNSGALAALQTRKGVCEDYAKLCAALARAAGIPARVAYGYADNNGSNWPVNSPFPLRGYRHAWVEYSLEGRGWVPAEPTRSTSSRLLFGTVQHNRYFIQNYNNQSLKSGYSGGKPTITWTESLY